MVIPGRQGGERAIGCPGAYVCTGRGRIESFRKPPRIVFRGVGGAGLFGGGGCFFSFEGLDGLVVGVWWGCLRDTGWIGGRLHLFDNRLVIHVPVLLI